MGADTDPPYNYPVRRKPRQYPNNKTKSKKPMISQQNISANTLMGANIVPGGGATFRVWAPRATAVYLNGVFGGVALWTN